jgi:hypothetical protein
MIPIPRTSVTGPKAFVSDVIRSPVPEERFEELSPFECRILILSSGYMLVSSACSPS